MSIKNVFKWKWLIIYRNIFFNLIFLSTLIFPVNGDTLGNGGSAWNNNSTMDNTIFNDNGNVVTGILDADAEIDYDLVFGWTTDVQYSLNPNDGMKAYSDSLSRFSSFINYFNTQKVSFIIEEGDLIDGSLDGKIQTLKELDEIESIYKNFVGPRYYVLGNHDVKNINVEDFKNHTGMNTTGAYGNTSFDAGNYHFVILDAQYDWMSGFHRDSLIYGSEGYIPQSQIDWLISDLNATTKKTVIFTHQLLENDSKRANLTIHNAAEVRNILENSGKVIGVFEGHEHINQHYNINGIHYFQIQAMLQSEGRNSYTKVYLKGDNIYVVGFERGFSYIKDDAWKENNYNQGAWGLSETEQTRSPSSYKFLPINIPRNNSYYIVERSFSAQDGNFNVDFNVFSEISTNDIEIKLNDNNSEIISIGFNKTSMGENTGLSDIYYIDANGSFVFLKDYSLKQWYTFRLTNFNFSRRSYDIYINDTLIKADAQFSGAGSRINKLQFRGKRTPGGSPFNPFYLDDIRVSKQNNGNITTWFDAGYGNETFQLDVNIRTPTNTNYSVWYRQNGTGNFMQVGGVYTGNKTIKLSPKYQNTDVRLVLNGNNTETPELISVTFYHGLNIISWDNNKTNDESLFLNTNAFAYIYRIWTGIVSELNKYKQDIVSDFY